MYHRPRLDFYRKQKDQFRLEVSNYKGALDRKWTSLTGKYFDLLKISFCSSEKFRRSCQANRNQKSESKSITWNGKYFQLKSNYYAFESKIFSTLTMTQGHKAIGQFRDNW